MKRRREFTVSVSPERARAVGIVKRLNRRMAENRIMPFILVCFEPVDGGKMKAESAAFGMRGEAGQILRKIAKEYLVKLDELEAKEASDGAKAGG